MNFREVGDDELIPVDEPPQEVLNLITRREIVIAREYEPVVDGDSGEYHEPCGPTASAMSVDHRRCDFGAGLRHRQERDHARR
jgi:hypothetical protein